MSDTEHDSDDSGDGNEAELDTGPERTGQIVGNYRLGRRLGRGGMAEVYEAYSTDELQSRVAIKVLHASYAHIPQCQKRFEAEALTLGKLKDPGVVQIIKFVKQDNNEAFLVMEYLDGTSLATYLKEQPEHRLSVDTALRLGAQAASTLHSVHQLNIIHRDLKPGNLMLVKDADVPGGIRIKIVDFGIARSTGRKRDQAPALTARGVAIGTLRYMSPEQLDARTVDTYSDVYSLGVVLFECLTGQLPFVGNEEAVRTQILKAEAPTLLSIFPSAPPQLSQLLRRMLAKVAGDRPNMSEVEQELLQIRSQLSQKQFPATENQDSVPPARPVSVEAAPERKKVHWVKRQGRYLALAVILLSAAVATWEFRNYQHRTQSTQQAPTPQPPISPGAQVPASPAAQPSSDPPAPVPSGPVITAIEGNSSMVQLLGSSSFMMGSTPKQIAEALAQCKQQATARSKTTHSASHYRCEEDSFAWEGPRHPVSIRKYSVDRHPVQVDSFVAFLNDLGTERSMRNDKDTHKLRFVDFKDKPVLDLYNTASGVLYNAATGRFSVKDGYSKRAIQYVSWIGAWQYCNAKGKRLLTEAEYEYAAFHNQEAIAKPLDLKLPGPMAEWVYDHFVGAYPSCLDAPCSSGEVANPTSNHSDYRTVRGCGPNEFPAYCRITARTRNTAAQGHFDTTFRCAMTLTK
jgi:serine/threonine protein kinase